MYLTFVIKFRRDNMTQMGELIDRSYTFIISEKLETLITARLPTGNTQCSRFGGIKYNAILSSIFLTNLQLGPRALI